MSYRSCPKYFCQATYFLSCVSKVYLALRVFTLTRVRVLPCTDYTLYPTLPLPLGVNCDYMHVFPVKCPLSMADITICNCNYQAGFVYFSLMENLLEILYILYMQATFMPR